MMASHLGSGSSSHTNTVLPVLKAGMTSLLFVGQEPFDEVDPFEREQSVNWSVLEPLLSGKTTMEASNILLELCRTPQYQTSLTVKQLSYAGICGALLFASLTSSPHSSSVSSAVISSGTSTPSTSSPPTSNSYFQNLEFITNDSWAVVGSMIKYMASHPKFPRLRSHVLHNLIRTLGRLMDHSIAEELLVDIHRYLLRQIKGGSDPSSQSMWLTTALLNMYQRCWAWIEKTPAVRLHILYTFTRLIPDHSGMLDVHRKEVDLVVRMLRREHPSEYHVLGRDFLLNLKQISLLSEIEPLWKEWILRCASTASGLRYPEMIKFLSIRTPQIFLLSRITPDMERKIWFILNQVERPTLLTFLERFRSRYFSSLGCESVYADVIRYVCGVIHPSNEILASKVVQRWDFISHLLRGIKSPEKCEKAKVAVFVDYIWYDDASDSIMNIEPGILLLYRGSREMKSLPDSRPEKCALEKLVKSMVDVLCSLPDSQFPMLKDMVKKHMGQAMHGILDKKVIGSLIPLYANLEEESKKKMDELFGIFLNRTKGQSPVPTLDEVLSRTSAQDDVIVVYDDDPMDGIVNHHIDSELRIEANLNRLLSSIENKNSDLFIPAATQGLDLYLDAAVDLAEREHWKRSLISALTAIQDSTDLLDLFFQQVFLFSSNFVDQVAEVQLRAIICLFFDLCKESDNRASRILTAFGSLCRSHPIHISAFKQIMSLIAAGFNLKLSAFIVSSIQHVYLNNLPLFYDLITELYAHLPDATAAGNMELAQMIIQMMDPVSLQTLRQSFILRDIDFVHSADIIAMSIEWPSYEQRCLWVMIQPEMKRNPSRREEFMLKGTDVLMTAIKRNDTLPEVRLGIESVMRISAPSKKFLYSVLALPDPAFLQLLFKNWKEILSEEKLIKGVLGAFAKHPAKDDISSILTLKQFSESGSCESPYAGLLENIAACFIP